ncbi:hypothetical protein DM558_03945 [Entomomonas moraniae]|uniref:DUF5675 domain-containing protein n=1 Tax=Entomomonas moraniae TaxID=2213226 RepID=A0A3S9XC28_9GAMM|nr:DUF5675 family protein [Entomomonas moraniae]AZS49979.1 hypothetical protein DM558_03945 [Entomomonas moraniae]
MTDKIKLTLVLEKSEYYGTFETITLPDGKTFYTLELPDKGNKRQVSCIPKGTYQCKIFNSAKFGKVYGICGVPNRIAILIHAGNYGGDIDKGYRTDIQDCILL